MKYGEDEAFNRAPKKIERRRNEENIPPPSHNIQVFIN